VGLCTDNVPAIADYVNTAQRRLIYAAQAGEEGWWGTWAEILFYASITEPYITLPRDVARLESVDICDSPVAVNNQFFEYLQFGNGRMPKCRSSCGLTAAFSRNNAVTFTDLSNAPQYITVFPTDASDVGRRILIQGPDENGNTIYTQDSLNQVQGVFLSLDQPFVTTPMKFGAITGIQKDKTVGQVRIYQTDPTTGEQVLLLTMEPSELTASYRRYYLSQLPRSCCSTTTTAIQSIPITAIAKLEMIPVQVDTDYLLLQNLEAIIEECQSIRLSEVDNKASKQMSAERHIQAIRMLNGELNHYLGNQSPAVNFAPFGTARLERQMIGRLM
jgi:hypothetical protein